MKRTKVFPVLLMFFCSIFCLTNTIIAGPTDNIMQQGTSGKWSWAACAQYAIYRILYEMGPVGDTDEFTKLLQTELEDNDIFFECDDSIFQRAILKRFGRDEESGDTRIFGNWLANFANRLLKEKYFAFSLNKDYNEISRLFSTIGSSEDNICWIMSVDCRGKGKHHVIFLDANIDGINYYDPYDSKHHIIDQKTIECMSFGPSILTQAYHGHTEHAKILTVSGFHAVKSNIK